MNFKISDQTKNELLVSLWKKININNSEYEITFEKGEALTVEKKASDIKVTYSSDSELFRSLLLAAELISENKDEKISEKNQFARKGVMMDMSRAGVMSIATLKEYIEYMALCGLNAIMLYMEDVYEVDTLPYFGYMRGRYSANELKEIDAYGQKFGVEVIPCIQTLGHFEQYIKWNEGKALSDTPTVVMPGEESTYEFIEKLIKTVSECFKTRKIHIGMDEAWGLGTGKYLLKNGYRNSHDVLCEHVAKVKEITDKYGLEPMIWSDMYFRLGSKTGDYYDLTSEMPENISEQIPENLGLTYWDYYHTDEEFYAHMITEHKKLTDNIVFAGGIWLWAGMLPDYSHTIASTNAGLNMCKKYGISDVYATVWGDDGCETDGRFSLPGCVLYGEHSYNEKVCDKRVDKKLKLLFNTEMSDFTDISKALYPFKEYELGGELLSIKQILYNDIICGMADYDMLDEKLVPLYNELSEKYKVLSEKEGYFKTHFDYVYKICKLAAHKLSILHKLNAAYPSDKITLADVKDNLLPELNKDFDELKNVHYDLWFKTYRPFGFEVVDIRYGGKKERINTAIRRLDDYLSGKAEALSELTEKRLPFINNNVLSYWHSGISYSFMPKGY